jgi:hypothetical protein
MKKREYIIIGGAFLLGFILMILFKVDCPWKKIFDIDCAGCGTTRMVVSLIQLDFYQAFRFNPFIFVLLVLCILYLGYILICKLLKKNYITIGKKTFVVIVLLSVIFMIFRNINGFEFLKPTVIR